MWFSNVAPSPIITIPHSLWFIVFSLHNCLVLTLKARGGETICPSTIEKAISLELQVGLTSNQAVNLSFSIVYVDVKKIINMDLEGTLEGLYLVQVPYNLCCRVHFGVHMGAMKVQEGALGSYYSTRISKK